MGTVSDHIYIYILYYYIMNMCGGWTVRVSEFLGAWIPIEHPSESPREVWVNIWNAKRNAERKHMKPKNASAKLIFWKVSVCNCILMFQPQVVKRSIISETDIALLKIIAGKQLFPFRLVHVMRLIEYMLVSRNLVVAPNHFHQFDYLLWSIKTLKTVKLLHIFSHQNMFWDIMRTLPAFLRIHFSHRGLPASGIVFHHSPTPLKKI